MNQKYSLLIATSCMALLSNVGIGIIGENQVFASNAIFG